MEKSSSISKDDIQDIDLIRLEDFITAKEEPCSFDEIAQEFPKFNIDSLRKLLQNLSQQEKMFLIFYFIIIIFYKK